MTEMSDLCYLRKPRLPHEIFADSQSYYWGQNEKTMVVKRTTECSWSFLTRLLDSHNIKLKYSPVGNFDFYSVSEESVGKHKVVVYFIYLVQSFRIPLFLFAVRF